VSGLLLLHSVRPHVDHGTFAAMISRPSRLQANPPEATAAPRFNHARSRHPTLVPLPFLGAKIGVAGFEADPCKSNLIWAAQG
jgi:hypothetical protein